MKYYLIAGEASGDLHASNLMKSLKNLDANADFRFFGGDLMQAQGGVPVKHYRELAYMGFIPVDHTPSGYHEKHGVVQERYCRISSRCSDSCRLSGI